MTDLNTLREQLDKLHPGKSYNLMTVFERLCDLGHLEPYQLDFFIAWIWGLKDEKGRHVFQLDMASYISHRHWKIERIDYLP